MNDLGWYERMAQRAKMRAAVERDGRLTGAEEWTAIMARNECIQKNRPEYLAGPPHGCAECYRWWCDPLGFWSWHHGPAIKPEMRPYIVDGEDWGPVEWCMHGCHGPGGCPLPVIAYG